jgi:hypothetical protein
MHLTYFLRRSDLQGEEEKENKESVGRRKEDVRQDLLESRSGDHAAQRIRRMKS